MVGWLFALLSYHSWVLFSSLTVTYVLYLNSGCYTVDDLTQILGVGHKAIYALIHKKAFPAIRISSIGYRIPKDTFNAWMHQQ